MALLASLRPPVVPAAVNEARALTLLTGVPRLIDAATPYERQAVVGALFDKEWIQGRRIVAAPTRADAGPRLAGLARVRYGCLDGVPDRFRTRNLLSHSLTRGHPRQSTAFFCFIVMRQKIHSRPHKSVFSVGLAVILAVRLHLPRPGLIAQPTD